MARDYAVAEVLTPPSPATSGTSMTVKSGQAANLGTDFPFRATLYNPTVAPVKAVIEEVSVSGITGDTISMTRAQNGTTAQSVAAGWLIVRGNYDNDKMNALTTSVDNAVVRFDGTGGKTVQTSVIKIDDVGRITDSVSPTTIQTSFGEAFAFTSDGPSPTFASGALAHYGTSYPRFTLARAKGSTATPATVAVNDIIGSYSFGALSTDGASGLRTSTGAMMLSAVTSISSGGNGVQSNVYFYDNFNGVQYLRLSPDATGSNGSYVEIVYGGSTNAFPIIKAAGTPTNSNLDLQAKGTGKVTISGVEAATISSSQTFTNKRLTARVNLVSTGTTLGPNADAYDATHVTAQAAALTIASIGGTPTDGQKYMFRFKDNGTAQSLTWNAAYAPIGVTLPTTTIANKVLYVGCVYNASSARWEVVAVSQEA